jgi:heptaprenyl diphosphate synthase
VTAHSLSRLGVLSACAVAVYIFESLIPSPFPWAKIGLSNTLVVVALFGLGLRDALTVNITRVVAGNLILGLIGSPAFLFSLLGSTSALMVMALARWKMVPPLSVVGTSCLGAVVNNAVQASLFTVLLSWSGIVRNLIGGFILLGVGVGFVTGLIASGILKKVVLDRIGPVG